VVVISIKKACIKCKIEKDLSEFPISKANKDGHRGICKECSNTYMRKYKKEGVLS